MDSPFTLQSIPMCIWNSWPIIEILTISLIEHLKLNRLNWPAQDQAANVGDSYEDIFIIITSLNMGIPLSFHSINVLRKLKLDLNIDSASSPKYFHCNMEYFGFESSLLI
jgi:hypothetical protein